jgi:secreted PhoX family phosphatase
MSASRRHFLKQTGAVAMGFAGLRSLFGMGALPRPVPVGYGPLQPDPRGVFDLPKGFSYRIISRYGDEMDDGFVVPHRADGMAAFPGPDGQTLLLRNHEVDAGDGIEEGAFGPDGERIARLAAERFYDAGRAGAHPALGGVTTLAYDTQRQETRRQHLSLAGTIRNCAGGPTPWNTWITCEETVLRAGDRWRKDHGYPFEVPATTDPAVAPPVPLTAMGRFNREAVAVDPASGAVYQTEDRHDGLLYRFLPDTPGELERGGRLQALAVGGRPSLDTRNWQDERTVVPGEAMHARWIDVGDVEAPEDDLRYRGFENGAARFARGEGIWMGDEDVFFACTNGGRIRKGQIWRYTPSPHEGAPREADAPGRLELFVEPNDPGLIDNADNLTVAPWGDVIACEDGSGDQYLAGVTPDGEIYKFARNARDGDSELAGATFSPDGTTLFVNVQDAGLTLAITGPWKKG